VNGAVDFLTRLGPARIAAMGVVTFALVGFFAFVIMRVSQPTMGCCSPSCRCRTRTPS